jgi:hypothetical protein
VRNPEKFYRRDIQGTIPRKIGGERGKRFEKRAPNEPHIETGNWGDSLTPRNHGKNICINGAEGGT